MWPVELHEGLSERIWARVRAVFVRSEDSGADLADGEDADVEARPGRATEAGPSLLDDPETRQRARDQQFARLERSALAEAIERELAHGLRGSKDDDER